MPQTFTQDVVIDGSTDAKQLRVQGHTTQTSPLQTWEDSAGNTLAQVTGDGRVQVGDDVGLASPDALIEAHRHENSTTKPKRGFHALGRITGTLNSVVQWVVAELELRGSGVISAIHSALRVKTTNLNTGTPTTGAELRGVDVEVVNDASAGAASLPKVTAIQATITNATGKTISDAAGLRVKFNDQASAPNITKAYSIFAEGKGIAHFEDYLELKSRDSGVGAGAGTGLLRIYPKSTDNGKLYGIYEGGTEFQIGGGGSSSVIQLYNDIVPANGKWDIELSTLTDGLNCLHLEVIILAQTNIAAAAQWIYMLFNNDGVDANYKSSLVYNNGGAGVLSGVFSLPYAAPVPGATAPATSFGITRIFIPFYQLTTALHTSQFTASYKYDTASGLNTLSGTHHWLSTAAINRIQLRASNDPTNKIVANSRLQILGYKF